ncbi:hypothetical protein AXI76_gp167 [Pseudoalteromonas phage H101]|uniref:Uncharacterized protein n=1 Tax=Pseudoalteromonas phage H101 TaxID=1654919 RepID=A0A0H4IS16_9CAUD|nr:hypothetical protein AXI76_gp167 [Pseudoalteromonas phage H101]AKO61068.1 hypothetical protein [Pseudoalteromonas phage H101]
MTTNTITIVATIPNIIIKLKTEGKLVVCTNKSISLIKKVKAKPTPVKNKPIMKVYATCHKPLTTPAKNNPHEVVGFGTIFFSMNQKLF